MIKVYFTTDGDNFKNSHLSRRKENKLTIGSSSPKKYICTPLREKCKRECKYYKSQRSKTPVNRVGFLETTDNMHH